MLSKIIIYSQTTDDYYDELHIRYDNFIYKPSIHTVLLHKEGFELSPPIIELNTDDRLLLSFDDFSDDIKEYFYTVIHCDADWKPSEILPSEYISGFTEVKIMDYKFSVNTVQKYIHYQSSFPNENFKITKSGNYILMIYENPKPDSIVLTRRFMVYEPRISIDIKVKRPTNVDYHDTKQEVDFEINYQGLTITDPFSEIKVVVMQNNRNDNAIQNLKPSFIRPNHLIYDYQEENTFWGGNEYRHFDIKSLRYQSEKIDSIVFGDNKYHVYLYKDKPRRFRPYSTEIDINGKRLISVQEGNDAGTEADYVYVHFCLAYDYPLVDGNLYVFGALSDWTIKNECQMCYNYEKKQYELTLYLKQGYYNYEYLYYKDGDKCADNTFIDGSFYETENDYTVYVYYRRITDRYDKFIGYKQVSSRAN